MDPTLLKAIVEAAKKDHKQYRRPYGMVRTIASSKNLTIELVEFTGSGSLSEHKHEKSRKMYFITGGTGELMINGQIFEVEGGDDFEIEKNIPHYWKSWDNELEFLVIITPTLHPEDVILTDDVPF